MHINTATGKVLASASNMTRVPSSVPEKRKRVQGMYYNYTPEYLGADSFDVVKKRLKSDLGSNSEAKLGCLETEIYFRELLTNALANTFYLILNRKKINNQFSESRLEKLIRDDIVSFNNHFCDPSGFVKLIDDKIADLLSHKQNSQMEKLIREIVVVAYKEINDIFPFDTALNKKKLFRRYLYTC